MTRRWLYARAMAEPAQLYAEARARIVELVRDPSVDPATPVPACPEWTLGDVVAHLAGVTADVHAGRIDGAATDEDREALHPAGEAAGGPQVDEGARVEVVDGVLGGRGRRDLPPAAV
jgi:hypothetical protein